MHASARDGCTGKHPGGESAPEADWKTNALPHHRGLEPAASVLRLGLSVGRSINWTIPANPAKSNYAQWIRTMPSELELCPPNSNYALRTRTELKICPPNSNCAPRAQTMPRVLELCPANSRPSDSVSLCNIAETKLYVTRVSGSLTLRALMSQYCAYYASRRCHNTVPTTFPADVTTLCLLRFPPMSHLCAQTRGLFCRNW